MPVDWAQVQEHLNANADTAADTLLSPGQRSVVRWLADRIALHGALVADEVGLGKTRIACALIDAVMQAGGRVAVIAPPRLLYQWQGEWNEYKTAAGREHAPEPQMLRGRQALFDQQIRYPVATSGHWLLLSSAFGGFRITHDDDRFIALLTLTADKIREKTNKSVTWGAKNAAASYGSQAWQSFHRAAKYLAGAEDRREVLREGLSRDRILAGLEGVKAKLAVGTPGRGLLHRTVGYLLGKVDLVIIDEAHKSREYSDDVNITALGRLLNEILLTSPNARRIALTATPVELDVKQWKSTLDRIRVNGVDLEPARTFRKAVHELRKYPTDTHAAADVAAAATAFSNSLSQFVVRRLRIKDPIFPCTDAARSVNRRICTSASHTGAD